LIAERPERKTKRPKTVLSRKQLFNQRPKEIEAVHSAMPNSEKSATRRDNKSQLEAAFLSVTGGAQKRPNHSFLDAKNGLSAPVLPKL
jgi:hypothetical protein